MEESKKYIRSKKASKSDFEIAFNTHQSGKIIEPFFLSRINRGSSGLLLNFGRATYEELKGNGVEFRSEPREQFYGVECIVPDGCDNLFSMTQPKEMPARGLAMTRAGL